MQAKVAGIRIKELPSKFGGTWKLATVKLEGHGEEKFELQGFGSKFVEKVKEGDVLIGYLGEKTFNGQTTKTFNKISAEYVYGLLMEMKGTPETPIAPTPAAADDDDSW
jgi:hypothetical protein